MKILNNAYEVKRIEKIFPIQHTCGYCGSLLELEEKDLYEGALGDYEVVCPVCKHNDEVYEVSGKLLTKDNIIFPDNFFNYEKGVDIKPEEIKRWIGDAINHFRKYPEEFCYTTGSGNTIIMVNNYSGDKEYHVIVAKGYYDTFIPYGYEDVVARYEEAVARYEDVVAQSKNKEDRK